MPPGTYECQCCYCGKLFQGHKREVICPDCAVPDGVGVGSDGTMYKDGEPIGRFVRPTEEDKAWGLECIKQRQHDRRAQRKTP